MNRLLYTALLTFFAIPFSVQAEGASPPPPASPQTAEADAAANALQQVYADYTSALLNKEGLKAASLLSANMLSIYGDALELAKTATREQLASVPAHKKLIALFIRWGATPEDLAAMTGPREVVAFMIRSGALRGEQHINTAVKDFEFKADEAFGHLYARGKKSDLRLRFAKEQDGWKLDLTELNPVVDVIYADAAKSQSITEDELLLQVVQSGTNKPVTEEIWTPLNQRKAEKA